MKKLSTSENACLRERKLRGNLTKLNFFYAIRGTGFIVAIFVPFLEGFGLSLTEIMILQSAFGAMLCVLEVPSGYFSDRFGRKLSVIIGSAALSLGFLFYSVGSDFVWFLIGELVLAVGLSFLSGADSSLLYDTLLELDEEDDYAKRLGRLNCIVNVSSALSGIVGAFLLEVYWRLPAYLETIVLFGLLPIALTLVEPKRISKISSNGEVEPRLGMIAIIKEALHFNRVVRQTILLSAVIAVSTLAAFWLTQPWQAQAGIPIALFGFIYAGLRIAVAFSSLLASGIYQKIGFNGVATICIAVIGFVYLGVAFVHYAWFVVAFLGFSVVRGFAVVIFSEKINKLISSDCRSTVLSIESLVCRLCFVPLGPFLGWIADLYSLTAAFVFSGVLFTLINGVLLWKCLRADQAAVDKVNKQNTELFYV